MYVKPLLSTVETSVATASCCWVGGGTSGSSVNLANGDTIKIPGLVIQRTPTGLCGNNPFPTCTNPLTARLCVVSPSFEVAAISVPGVISFSGASAGATVSGLP